MPPAEVVLPLAPVSTTPAQPRYNPTLEAAKAKLAAGRRLKSSERLELMRDAEARGQKVSGLDKTSATLDVLGKGSCAGGCLLVIVAIVIAAIAAAVHTSFWVVAIVFVVASSQGSRGAETQASLMAMRSVSARTDTSPGRLHVGRALVGKGEHMPFCRRCGAPMDETARFCPQCAAPVDEAATPAQPVPPGGPSPTPAVAAASPQAQAVPPATTPPTPTPQAATRPAETPTAPRRQRSTRPWYLRWYMLIIFPLVFVVFYVVGLVDKSKRRTDIGLYTIIACVLLGLTAVSVALPHQRTPPPTTTRATAPTPTPTASSAASPATSWTKVASLSREVPATAQPLKDFESPLFTAKKSAERFGWNVTPVAGQYLWSIGVYRKGQNPNGSSQSSGVLYLNSNATYGSGIANSGAKDFRLKPGEQYYIFEELRHCAATVAVSQKGSTGGTAWNGVPARPSPVAVVSPKPSPPMSQDQQAARNFIRAAGKNARGIEAQVQAAQIAVYLANKSPTQKNVDQLAQIAQQARDNIDALRSEFALTVTTRSGKLQDDENLVSMAADDLSSAMRLLVAYTGTPNPATLAQFTTQYASARSEWNTAVRGIWRLAREKKPPTV